MPLATTPPTTVPATTVVGDTSGRQWLVPVPIGCDAPALPDVVFVGTLRETGTPSGQTERTENETARFQVDQVRAGAVDRFAYGGLIDVRFGTDAKYLEEGEQYLVAASVDPVAAVLASKVRQPEPEFGGDEVIGASESDVSCPESGRSRAHQPHGRHADRRRCRRPRSPAPSGVCCGRSCCRPWWPSA